MMFQNHVGLFIRLYVVVDQNAVHVQLMLFQIVLVAELLIAQFAKVLNAAATARPVQHHHRLVLTIRQILISAIVVVVVAVRHW